MTTTQASSTGLLWARRVRKSRLRSRRRGQRSMGRALLPWLYLALPIGFVVLFTGIPLTNMVWYSFTDWDGLSPVKEYVGFENYVEIFSDPDLFGVFFVSLYYLVGAIVQIGLALYLATVLSFTLPLRNLFKGIVFFPYLINGVAIAFIFLFFFQPGGTLDLTLQFFGLGALSQQWLGDPAVVNWSLAGVSVWRYIGLNVVLYIGAIQSISPDLFEAADIDGASRWQQFRYIIAPSVKRITALTTILAISGALAVFEIPYIMLGGANGTATFVIETVRKAFVYNEIGLASAMAVVLLALVLVITIIQRLTIKDEVDLA
ncbi:sugar ABC transporter permease [Microbacterium sp. BK668]|uniref:carbohydrate ABC transporter permease n=1 Tax=Microbacterium sp. BK668 TaxID=2512118 RepID=UPI00105FADC5|nr:sugar ABC transporter permease [Microbacterium sp. BK668]TDN91544.1 carbohydrate ABC transporter membrane protein 1 (CUT1 family) [Microbacterium sp. BK668]